MVDELQYLVKIIEYLSLRGHLSGKLKINLEIEVAVNIFDDFCVLPWVSRFFRPLQCHVI